MSMPVTPNGGVPHNSPEGEEPSSGRTAGALPTTDTGQEEVRRRTLVRIVLYTVALGFIWCLLHLAIGLWPVTVPVTSYIVLSLLNLGVFRRTGSYERFRMIQLILILFLPFFTQLAYGGFVPAGAIVIASFIAPVGALMFHRVEVARIMCFLFVGVVLLAAVLEAMGLVPGVGVSSEFGLILFVINIVSVTALLYFTVESFLRQRDHLNELLAERNDELEETLQKLKSMQRQLIQQEKLASLGQLTAGIAHEIKNPLNFINNFSEVLSELAEEAGEALAEGADREELKAMLADVRMNAGKIAEHGRRADGIVRSMLEHSRGMKGERQLIAANALVEEYLNLAFHGFRAQASGLHVTLERAYDEQAGRIDVVPQEIGRVLLNLLNNAFQAVQGQAEREVGAPIEAGVPSGHGYVPTVSVSTRRRGAHLEIRIADNGPGIDDAVRERIFEPFFTTKPTGQGTGLGLSISYDIVTSGHGGSLTIEHREVGTGATFVVTLNRPGFSETWLGE